MIKCGCDSCIYAIYDKYPYGMGYAEELTGCAVEDEMGEEEYEKICDDKIDCPHYKASRDYPHGFFIVILRKR